MPGRQGANDQPEGAREAASRQAAGAPAKAESVYRDARAHPDSEAEEMVRILLLGGISSMRPEIANDKAEAQAEERQRLRSALKARAKPGADAGSAFPEAD